MTAGQLRLWIIYAAMPYLFISSWHVNAWRLDVTITPRAVEKDIGMPATVVCDIRNMDRATQFLSWLFLDADSVHDQLVSAETTVQDSYRDRFSVSMASIGVRRIRYGLSISHLRNEDDGTYLCQVIDTFTYTVVQNSAVSVSVLYFPDPPSCVPSGKFFVMANSLIKLSCTSSSGNPTVNMKITRKVSGVNAVPVVPPPTAAVARPANWTYFENDDTIVRELTVDISSRYTGSSFPCTISSPSPLVSAITSSCVIGPIYVVPVAPTSSISVTVEPRALRVTAGQPAKFTCLMAISPHVDMAWVQKTWSTFPLIEPERLVKRDVNYAEAVWIRAVEIDDDGLVVTCKTVIRGITRKASSQLRVILPTLPPQTTPMRVTTAAPTKHAVRTATSLISLVTRNDIFTKSTGKHNTVPLMTENRSRFITTTSPVGPGQTLMPTLPIVLKRPWYSKPTGIALIVMTLLFVSVIIIGVAYVKRFPRFPRLSRKVSQKCRNLRYQNVWGSSRQATMRREASRRQQVTVSSTHIYHEARILPDKSQVDSTVDGFSGQPLVVYAETVVNSLYEGDDDRSRTMPCNKSGVPKNNRKKYGNVIGGLNDASKHVTLPNNFMIYSDFNLENANQYESLIGT